MVPETIRECVYKVIASYTHKSNQKQICLHYDKCVVKKDIEYKIFIGVGDLFWSASIRQKIDINVHLFIEMEFLSSWNFK
jgi:hypothetical protein